MSKAEKLAAKILSGKSDKNFAFNDLCPRPAAQPKLDSERIEKARRGRIPTTSHDEWL